MSRIEFLRALRQKLLESMSASEADEQVSSSKLVCRRTTSINFSAFTVASCALESSAWIAAALSFSSRCSASVSYTHLDVYKRQELSIHPAQQFCLWWKTRYRHSPAQ